MQNARLFAAVAQAMDDAMIGVFDAKYHYNFWRPVTAIRNGDIDGNDATARDASWQPLIDTPMHPEYPSAHSILAAAVGTVLQADAGGAPLPLLTHQQPVGQGATRHWRSIDALRRRGVDRTHRARRALAQLDRGRRDDGPPDRRARSSALPGVGTTPVDRGCARAAACSRYCTERALSVGVASKIGVDGHIGQVSPSALGAFGSPRRAKAARLAIIACDSARRPGRLAVELAMLENSDGPKVPKTNDRSKACAAP